MRCKELIKENHNVFMIDKKGIKLDLENDFDIQKYEKTNNINVIKLVNDFINEKDNNFKNIIKDIENMVKKYNIDYFMYGDGKTVSEESLALLYNLKNRNSCVDCNLKIFYQEKYKSIPIIQYMIEFSEGTSGNNFGFSFYKYFDIYNYNDIKKLLEDYFSSNTSGNKDQNVINSCIGNVRNRLRYYYSE